MRKRVSILRFIYINYVLARHGLDRIILSLPLFYSLRFISYLNPWNWYRYQARSRGERIRKSLEELGPIFVKFGQVLSTRRDILPEDIADELALLQDRVPPFPTKIVYEILETEYKQPVSTIFKYLDEKPLAAASIAQVHAATLWNDKEVIVKILRPNIEKIIIRDIELLYMFARMVTKYYERGKRLRPIEVVAEFERTIMHELDLMREAANASQLRRNFANSSLLYVPQVEWPFAKSRVIVMERIRGVPISDIATLTQYGMDLKQLANMGVEIFFTQVFRDCFFHADMHPGNIFVDVSNPKNPRYLAVDFGIMGTLNPVDQRYLAENLLAFFKRDYQRVAELHLESGWVPAYIRVDEFESAIRTVCEPMFERPLKEISAGRMLLHLFQAASAFDMEIQPQLVLLQKTLLNVEGLGIQLYPDLDLWETARPFLEEWVHDQMGPKMLFRKIREKAPYWIEKLPEIPDLLYQSLQRAKENKLKEDMWQLEREVHVLNLQLIKKRFFLWGFGFALALAGTSYYFLNKF